MHDWRDAEPRRFTRSGVAIVVAARRRARIATSSAGRSASLPRGRRRRISSAEVEREDAVAEEERDERAARQKRPERNRELRVGALIDHQADTDDRADQ